MKLLEQGQVGFAQEPGNNLDGCSSRSNKSSDDEKLSVQCGISEKESKYQQLQSSFDN